jgi:flagellar motility protein MotE (MotC chaperone)
MAASQTRTGKTLAGVGALAAVSLALLLAASVPAAPEATAVLVPGEAPKPNQPEPAVDRLQASVSKGTEIERFCSNIADAARDRRYTLQAKELAILQQEVDKRIKLLEEKRAEYESWLKRRDDFLARAEDGVVKIYAGMRPDAAAERLAELDVTLAAGILMKIDARKAGVILNEMERKAAATLTGIMASTARKTDPS